MLYLIGLGLGDEKDVSLRGLEIIRKCDKVYLEAYTSLLCSYGKKNPEETIENMIERMGTLYGKKVLPMKRQDVEENESLIKESRIMDVSLLVSGDPLSATTHMDMVMKCEKAGVEVEVVHNASIITAVGATGLFLYNFGQVVSIPLFQDSWRPYSFYNRIKMNQSIGLHTLLLFDIQMGDEYNKGPRLMNIKEAAAQLYEVENERGLGIATAKTLGILVCGLGSCKKRIVSGYLCDIESYDCGEALQSLILPCESNLNEVEKEAIKRYSIGNR